MTAPEDTRPLDWMRRSTIEGFTALVVGAGSGMGAACARTYAANGGAVVVADLDGNSAAAVTADIVARGGRATSVQMDVAASVDIDRAVELTVQTYGRLDSLLNISTMVRGAMLEDARLDAWDAAFAVNVRGALLLAQACLPHMRRSPAPAIVHTGSLAGVNGYAGSGSYGPSKAALMTMSRQMALEWAIDGIRVNVVVPGTIHTPGMEASLSETAIETRKGQIPLGRLSLPSEQADLVVFLASPAASFITGQTFVCDGGFSQSLYPQPMGWSETLRERADRLTEG